MKKLLLIGIALMSFVLLYLAFAGYDTSTNPILSSQVSTSTNSSKNPQRETIDTIDIPDNIYETVCMLGHPVLVSGWELDSETRFVFFTGPFKVSSDANSVIYQYTYRSLKSIESEKYSSALLVHSLKEYQASALPEDLKKFQLPILHGIPDKLPKLVKILGQWDVEVAKKNPQRRRLIYDRKMCIGTKLVRGAYFDLVDNRVVKAKGIKTKNKLARLIQNRQIPRPDKQPLRYIDNTPETGSAKDVITKLVLLSEAGKQAEAMKLLSDQLQSNMIRNELTRQAEKGVSIKLDSLTYQATKYTHDSAYITVKYYLQNGSIIKAKHKLIRESGRWRVRF